MKKSLKELLVIQDFGEVDDIEIIEKWFVANDMEQEGIELISRLSKIKAEKVQRQLDFARSWGLSVGDMRDVIKDKEVAIKLNDLIRCATLNYPLKSCKYLYEWAKENCPKIKIPKIFFMPTIKYLLQWRIRFDMTDDEIKSSFTTCRQFFNDDFTEGAE